MGETVIDRGQHGRAVVEFYDTHPINEHQILENLGKNGKDPGPLTQDQLQGYDQDHYGGVEAVEVLARAAGIAGDSYVLDVGSGMGGPARHLARTYGCRVTGIDFTESRVIGAERITKMVGLDRRVDFRHVSALDSGLPDRTFDAVIGQEAWCHIPDKPRLVAECVRVTKTGGSIAFTDIVKRPATAREALERLRQGMAMVEVATMEDYVGLFEDAGCSVLRSEDLSEEWAAVLVDRLAMYRGLKDQTIGRFGEDHFRKWDDIYSFFVGLFKTGELGGCRIVARRAR